MKKVLLIIAIIAVGFTANAQDGQFNVGVNLGLPTGDAGDISTFTVGAEANYLFELSDEFKLGPSVSYMHYFGKTFDIPGIPALGIAAQSISTDISFLPIAAAGRYSVSEEFTLGADLGYGIGVSPSGTDSGLYYRPMVGYNVSENMMIQAAYSGISVNGGTFSNFSVGAMFSL